MAMCGCIFCLKNKYVKYSVFVEVKDEPDRNAISVRSKREGENANAPSM